MTCPSSEGRLEASPSRKPLLVGIRSLMTLNVLLPPCSQPGKKEAETGPELSYLNVIECCSAPKPSRLAHSIASVTGELLGKYLETVSIFMEQQSQPQSLQSSDAYISTV